MEDDIKQLVEDGIREMRERIEEGRPCLLLTDPDHVDEIRDGFREAGIDIDPIGTATLQDEFVNLETFAEAMASKRKVIRIVREGTHVQTFIPMTTTEEDLTVIRKALKARGLLRSIRILGRD